MQQHLIKSRKSKIVFVLSLLLFAFWFTGQVINVYHYAFIGAMFEMLWLPMLAMLFVLPVVTLVFWAREKFIVKSLYLYSILIIVAVIIILLLQK